VSDAFDTVNDTVELRLGSIGMAMTESAVNGLVVVNLSGEIDLSNADDLPPALSQVATTPDVSAVHVDLAAVSFIDSSGLRALLISEAHLAKVGSEFKVCNPTEHTRRLFELTGLTHLIAE
jgi:anti-anti-sigma factor